MNLKKIIGIFYTTYTIYILLLIGATTLSFSKTSLAIILMWINYILFSMGYNVKKKSIIQKEKSKRVPWLLNRKKSTLLTIAGLSILFSIVSVKYYTGQYPLSVLKNLANNVSVYYTYQQYFSEQQRYLFSITKIPFILMVFYIKLILFYSYLSLLLIKQGTTRFEKFYLIIVTLAYVYIGISRGTSFEFFELLILVVYILLSRYKEQVIINLKPIIFSLILGGLGIYIFVTGVSARGFQFDLSTVGPDINYDHNGWLSELFPFLAVLLFKLYGYFGFGFYYISTYVTEIWFASLGNFFLGMLPLGYQSFTGNNIPTIMNNIIHIGVRWNPDFILAVNNLGYVGLLMFCFFMGIISKYFFTIEEKKPVLELTNYMILLQMISLPVGKFLFTSSANQIIVITLLIYWFWRVFINRRIRL